MRLKSNATRLLFAGLASVSMASIASDFVVVAASNSSIGQLSKEQVTELFLGKSSVLPGGGKAVLIDQPDAGHLRDTFYSKVTGKSAAQARSTWAKLAFTGKGTPPLEGSSNDDIKRQVANNKNMLGYIDKSSVDGSVKTVFTP